MLCDYDGTDEDFNIEDYAENLLWNNVVPQQYVPETVTETGTFIFYDIDENALYSRNSKQSIYTELTVYFWVLTHKDMPKYKGKLRNDICSRELKLLFENSGGLGISKNHLIYNKVYDNRSLKYMGRILAFRITDFADKVRLRYSEDKPNRA